MLRELANCGSLNGKLERLMLWLEQEYRAPSTSNIAIFRTCTRRQGAVASIA
jgi:hypothetical protein